MESIDEMIVLRILYPASPVLIQCLSPSDILCASFLDIVGIAVEALIADSAKYALNS